MTNDFSPTDLQDWAWLLAEACDEALKPAAPAKQSVWSKGFSALKSAAAGTFAGLSETTTSADCAGYWA